MKETGIYQQHENAKNTVKGLKVRAAVKHRLHLSQLGFARKTGIFISYFLTCLTKRTAELLFFFIPVSGLRPLIRLFAAIYKNTT
jgi:hypothetical protein